MMVYPSSLRYCLVPVLISLLGMLFDSSLRCFFFFFSSRRRHTRYWRDWSSDVCSSDLLELFPAQHALLDQHFAGGGSVDAALDDLDEFGLVIGDAAAGAAHGEARPDDRRQADVLERRQRRRQRLEIGRASCRERLLWSR